jgi:hypothetical protein
MLSVDILRRKGCGGSSDAPQSIHHLLPAMCNQFRLNHLRPRSLGKIREEDDISTAMARPSSTLGTDFLYGYIKVTHSPACSPHPYSVIWFSGSLGPYEMGVDIAYYSPPPPVSPLLWGGRSHDTMLIPKPQTSQKINNGTIENK